MKNLNIRKITATGVLLALEIIFCVFNITIKIGPLECNVGLIPIAAGSILVGPFAGVVLGLTNGLFTFFSPVTQEVFAQYAVVGTFFTCTLKTLIAGVLPCYVFRLIAKKNFAVGAVVATLLVPILNTGLFILGCLTIVRPAVINAIQNQAFAGTFVSFIFVGFVGLNFFLEFGLICVLAPVLATAMYYIRKRYNNALSL